MGLSTAFSGRYAHGDDRVAVYARGAEDEAFHARLFPPPTFPPDGLRDAGRTLWFSLTGAVAVGHELDAKSLLCLSGPAAARTRSRRLRSGVDIDGVIVNGSREQPVIHPGVQEGRQLRLVELRLLRQIDLGSDEPERDTPARRRARHAARSRWIRVADTAAPDGCRSLARLKPIQIAQRPPKCCGPRELGPTRVSKRRRPALY
jgi:hypothetical protein